MIEESHRFKIFAGGKGLLLAERICAQLGTKLSKVKIEHFSDGEYAAEFEDSVRGQAVYLVQATCPSADNLMELLLMIDAARRASASAIVAVIPYFGWARQDRKDKARVSIGAKLIANMLQVAGVDRIITLDLHAEQIQGFFDIPVDHLYGLTTFSDYIESLKLDDLIIASPDEGGSKRAAKLAARLNAPMVMCYKNRQKANEIVEMRVLGDVSGKNVVLIDDIADTAGTLAKAADLLSEQGAKSVRAVVSHGLMSGNACQKVMDSKLEELIFTDTLPFDNSRCAKVKILSVAKPFAETIMAIQEHRSISEFNLRN
ncbi:MAG: ribose-phosphate pyrophosphokinase [Paludibacteraceae bacterium]|nr:ribose-phosphate pyrophosphokinase [Paludibacteraceae bacterium]